jgi:lauroyl/myristoyl acyltransferase
MPFWASPDRLIQAIDYGYLLPALARMPLGLGEALSRVRGGIQAIFDYDWRSMALGRRYVRERTYQAMRMIQPLAGRRAWIRSTLNRFVHNSREEWQACVFQKEVMLRIARKSRVEGLQDLLRFQRQGRGLVMVSAHWDSFCIGMVLLGMNGFRTHVINTSMIEDPRIHPVVRSFFDRKYRAMEHLMRGKMVYHQVNLPFFYDALRRGELVTLLGDIPGSKSTVFIPFLGSRFRMPLGAWKMAKETGSALGAFVCLNQAPETYRVICLPPKEIHPESPRKTLEPVYEFLEHWIRWAPERWVSADLLPAYGSLS